MSRREPTFSASEIAVAEAVRGQHPADWTLAERRRFREALDALRAERAS